MSGCDFHADDVFGPQVVGCRDSFDFTLLFEQSILSIGPSVAATLVSAGFIAYLMRQHVKTKPGAKRRSRAVKQVTEPGPVLGEQLSPGHRLH